MLAAQSFSLMILKKFVYCQVAPSGTGAPVGTWLPIQATDTSSFATKGFSIAMSIAL